MSEVRKYVRAFDDRVFDDIYATKLAMSKHNPVRHMAGRQKPCVAPKMFVSTLK